MKTIATLLVMMLCLPLHAKGSEDRLSEYMDRVSDYAAQDVDFHYGLRTLTASMFEDYRHIVEIVPGPDSDKEVKNLTHQFATGFQVWSLAVARATNGSTEAYRLRIHRNFCLSIFLTMADYAPGHNPTVEREFRKDFMNELAALEPQQKARVSSLWGRFIHRTKKISFTEGMDAIAVSAAIFQVIQQNTGNWIDADIGGFAGFLGTLEVLKDLIKPRPDQELVAQRVALAFNNDARKLCEDHLLIRQ